MSATLKMLIEATLRSTEPSASARCLRRSERSPVASCSDVRHPLAQRLQQAGRLLSPLILVSRLIIRWATWRKISAATMIRRIRSGLTST